VRFQEEIMKKIITVAVLALTVATGAYAASDAHTHIGHVVSSWEDTPSERGLLPTAFKESLVAAAHANYAVNAADNFASMKTHAGHVRHAIDPTLEQGGPGLGYGLLKATNGSIKHITLASESVGASEAVKTHTVHVVTSLNNALERTDLALIEADAIIAAANAAEALPHAIELARLTKAAFAGVDADGDGKISWEKGEGGLQVADKHMGFMLDAEGLKR
jgi:hypothetical protein